MNLTPDLDRWRREIEGYAREFGLDFYDVVFEVLDYDQLNEVAAYGGFPTRYPHWRFGMDYEELAKTYSYGLSKIYELVINNNPVYAYLMKANAPGLEPKLLRGNGEGDPLTLDQVRKVVADGVREGRRQVVLQADGSVPHGEVLKLAAAVTELEGVTLHIGVQEPID